ncbi:MAG: hypothetical protein WCC84_14170 [Candidatus Cybelea sp.]
MQRSSSIRYAPALMLAGTLFAACSGASQLPSATPMQPSVTQPGANAQPNDHGPGLQAPNRANPVPRDRNRSWMAPDAGNGNLIYISDANTSNVWVLSYPRGTLKGQLTFLDTPEGECVDRSGDVFIVSFGSSEILEFAHGGTNPIAVLNDAGYFPNGCAVDPTTGTLAVTNYETSGSLAGNVAIYTNASGSPRYHSVGAMFPFFCAYDATGDLYVDGKNYASGFGFLELPTRSISFKNIALNQSIGEPGGVQWDGQHVVVGDSSSNVIYQFSIDGSNGTEIGSTTLGGASDVANFLIQKRKVIGTDLGTDVGVWRYPAGGSAIGGFNLFENPVGLAISDVTT